MTARTILALTLLLSVRTAAQDVQKPQAQCRFSSGETITVTYSSERTKALRLATDGTLITIKGISVPVGEYSVSLVENSHNNWTLTMKKQTGSGETSAL